MTAVSQNMRDIETAVEHMDAIYSGRLELIDLKRPQQRGPYQNYDMKNYGVLKCTDSGTEYQVRGTDIMADERGRTFILILSPTHSVCFRAANRSQFKEWASAIRKEQEDVIEDAVLVNRAEPLVRGASCSVYAGVRERDGLNIATKVVSKNTETRIAALAEATVGTRLKEIRKNRFPKELVRVLNVYHTSNEAHVVMDRVRGRSLQSWLEEHEYMSEVMAKDLLKQILRAINFLHENHIIHGAIWPGNILILHQGGDANQGNLDIKLIGYNAASWREYGTFFPQRPLSEYHRCLAKDGLEYIAPEIWAGLPPTTDVDFWALGCTLYRTLIGKLPFAVNDLRQWERGQEPTDTMRHFAEEAKIHTSRKLLLPEDCERVQRLTPNALSLLYQLIRPNPEQRMNKCEGIEDHPWMACPPFPPRWNTKGESTRSGARRGRRI